MLHEFLTANRTALITRCRTKVAKRFAPSETPRALDHGVPLFLQQSSRPFVFSKNLPTQGRRQLLRRSVAPPAYTVLTCYVRDTVLNRSSASMEMCAKPSAS